MIDVAVEVETEVCTDVAVEVETEVETSVELMVVVEVEGALVKATPATTARMMTTTTRAATTCVTACLYFLVRNMKASLGFGIYKPCGLVSATVISRNLH